MQKAGFTEPARILHHVIRSEAVERVFKPLERVDQTPGGLFREKYACDSIQDCFQRASASIGDDRATCGLRLYIGDSEILLCRADKSAGAACMPSKSEPMPT